MGLELERSRAQRIIWLPTRGAWSQIHPLGKSPVITVDDLVLAESGFIVEYLTTRWGRLRPDPSSPAAMQYQYPLHYVEGTLMPPLVIGEVMQQIKKSPQIPFLIKPIANIIVNGVYHNYLNSTYEGNFRFLETLLDGKEYFAGEFSGADVMLGFPLVEAAKGRVKGFDKQMFPNLFAWMDRVSSREGYKQAEARTEKHEQLLDK
ncbi:hypothetical protein L211DRAFT_403262 [Terfezia boudieri ATCC MYA-4762]|uniref:GST N-terminal domain-containing protein n=1 Tax=Terfezia boudieri ATCC MYA-4762 TaxID=1051890 RepID=A0A3N4M704_9PEZI|nr:hypothetical protein L211DRAFT_403262 [Terfezia boudieri ATCC MYA-4762]